MIYRRNAAQQGGAAAAEPQRVPTEPCVLPPSIVVAH
jgi:hypothetical protein